MAVVDVNISKPYSADLIKERPALIATNSHLNNSVKNSAMAERINSALVTEQDLHNYLRTNKTQSNGHVTYTRFKPVTSYPTTSLIATLYKQQALGESRYQQQTQDKLPNLFHRPKFAQQNITSKRRRGIRSFAYPSHAAATAKASPRQDQMRFANENQGPGSTASQIYSRAGSASTGVGASATWTAVHASIAANGHSMFPGAPEQRKTSTLGSAKPVTYHHSVLQRTSVNYVPFYEIRGRGDGASVVDVPSIDVEGKKIEGGTAFAQEKTPFSVIESTAQEPKQEEHSSSKMESDKEVIPTQNDRAHLNRTPTDTNEETLDSLVSALIRRSQKDVTSSSATPTKVEKKVRFSSSVTTNQIDEPSYTETLLESLRRRIENNNTESHSVSSAGSKGAKEKSSDANSGTNRFSTEDDEPMFVTPVMKVIVTKRQGPTGAEAKGSTTVNIAARDADLSHTSPQRRIANMASRVINNYVSISPPNDVLRRGTQATRRASTAGQARSTEALARVSKLVPKRQTVVMPTFPKQPAWSKRSLTVQSSASSKLRASVAPSTAFTAAVRGSSFEKSPRPEAPGKQNLDNLQTRLNSAGAGVYISTSQDANRASTTKAAQDRVKSYSANPSKSVGDNASSSAYNSTRNVVDVPSATDFQPIPSMPDHINFCDPRKTELIMRWLEDVNKKRNIDSKIKRSATFRRLKAAP